MAKKQPPATAKEIVNAAVNDYAEKNGLATEVESEQPPLGMTEGENAPERLATGEMDGENSKEVYEPQKEESPFTQPENAENVKELKKPREDVFYFAEEVRVKTGEPLLDSEYKELSLEMVRLNEEISSIEREKKAAADMYKGQIGEKENELSLVIEAVKANQHVADAQILWTIPRWGTWRFVNSATQEATERPMTNEEKGKYKAAYEKFNGSLFPQDEHVKGAGVVPAEKVAPKNTSKKKRGNNDLNAHIDEDEAAFHESAFEREDYEVN